MASDSAKARPPYRRQLQQIATNLSEGVILIDVDQTIRWANDAALAMHGVDRLDALGRTIDEYHANFQIKFRTYQPAASQQSIERVAAGEAFRDVVIEVTPLGGDKPAWVHRVRNLVLTDDAGSPACVALVLHAVNEAFPAKGQFGASLDSMPHAAIILRLADQIIVGANDAFLDLAGLERSKVIARALSEIDFVAGAEAPEHVLRCLADSAPLALSKSTLRVADGHSRAVLLAGQPIDFDDQRCMLFSFIAAGPVLSAAAAHIAQNARAAAETLCAVTPVPMHALDADRRVIAVSDAWLDWLGYARVNVIGHDIADFMTPASALQFSGHFWAELHQGGAVRDAACQFVNAAGEVLDTLVAIRATPDEGGAPAVAVAAPVDISERKRGDERFAKLFALSPVPMLIRRLEDARILDANDAFLAATGHSAQTVVGHNVDELGLFETRAQRQHFEQELRSTGRPRNLEARLKTTSGEHLDCLLSAELAQVFGQACVLMVLQDVTEQRRNETQLYQAIETVMKDTSWFSRSVIEKLATVRTPQPAGARTAALDDLTRREREVLGLISHGLSDSDIAEKLGLTRSTVRNHVATLYSKIGVHSRRNAIVWARERGINIAWPPAVAASHARRTVAL
jgi:PAS domain S-box-containing protein